MKKQNYVGATILGIAIIVISILVYQFISKKGIFEDSTILYAFTRDAVGITADTPVLIQGFPIGKVRDLKLINESKKVLVELSINKDINLSQESSLVSTPSGLFGGRQIDVENSKNGDTVYIDGDTIKSEIITTLMNALVDSTDMKKIESTLKEVSKSLGKALQDYGESGDETDVKETEKQ